jgi:undecaprenyl-diphosphatase
MFRLAVATLLLVVLLILEWAFGDTLIDFSSRLLRGTSAIPAWLLDSAVTLTYLGALLFLAGGLATGVRRGRWRLLLVVALAIVVAVLLNTVLGHVDPAEGARAVDLHGLVPSGFPTAGGLAAAAAIATAIAPWATRRWRRIAWCLVVAMTFAHALVNPISFAAVRALLTGWWAGAAALVLLGAPVRRPSRASIAVGLQAVGLQMAALEQAGVDARGSTPYFGTTVDGRRLFVKALGADERSADLMFRTFRGLLPHNLGDERPFSSLRRTVEHEALLALMAAEVGIRTPRFVSLTRADPNAFVLAYEAIEGSSLDGVDVDDLDDDLLHSVWEQIARLHQHRIAHRDLRLANIFRGTDGTIWLIDFGFSEAAARELLLDTDRAELVASTATRLGASRAVAVAAMHLDADELARVLARTRPWALSGATRTALKRDPELFAALRAELTRAAAVPT